MRALKSPAPWDKGPGFLNPKFEWIFTDEADGHEKEPDTPSASFIRLAQWCPYQATFLRDPKWHVPFMDSAGNNPDAEGTAAGFMGCHLLF